MNKFHSPQPLHAEYETAAFDCGSPPLNEFLKLHALDKQRAMLSRTYVVTSRADTLRVVGYYTLAHISALQDEVPKKLGRGMPSSIPSLLMARFAVDLAYQGQGLGRSLFTDAIRRTWNVMADGTAPVRLFVVDAKDETAKAFYEHFGMTATPQNPLRLYLSYKSLRALFEE